MRQTARCLTGSVAFGTKGAWLLPQLACTLLSQMGQGPSRLGEVPDIVRLAPQNPALAQGDHHEPERSLTKACTSVTNLTSGPSDSLYLGLGGEGAAENKTAPGTQKERRQEKAVEASRPPALFRSKLLKFLGNRKSVLRVVCGAR